MKTRWSALLLLLLLALAPAARADFLTLSGEDLSYNPLSDPSPTFVVGINNPTGTTTPLVAWSLGLEIVATPGATGTLQFATATLPTNYLLDGRSGGLTPPFSGPTTSIMPIGDNDSQFTGVVVPTSGDNLLATTFTASSGASGVFQIFAVPDPTTGSYWFSTDFTNVRGFANVPFGGGPVLLGDITLVNAVPEPGSAALMLVGGSLVLILARRTRRG